MKTFCIYCGRNLSHELSGINWAEVMAIEDQIPDPDELPVTLDLDSETFCLECEHEYLVRAKVRVSGDSGEIVSLTIEDRIGDDDKHPAYCQKCKAELVAILPELESWVCPTCNGIDTTNIPITEDCPHCGFPCHQEHIDVVRCVECKKLDFEYAGQYIVPDLDRPGSRFYCGDCCDELFPEEEE